MGVYKYERDKTYSGWTTDALIAMTEAHESGATRFEWSDQKGTRIVVEWTRVSTNREEPR